MSHPLKIVIVEQRKANKRDQIYLPGLFEAVDRKILHPVNQPMMIVEPTSHICLNKEHPMSEVTLSK